MPTQASNDPCYPEFIPNSHEVNTAPWKVHEISDPKKASSDKVNKELYVPPMHLKTDLLIRRHEQLHIRRPQWPRTSNTTRDVLRRMLEEVALDGESLFRDGIDLRPARLPWDYSDFPVGRTPIEATAEVLQLFTGEAINVGGGGAPTNASLHENYTQQMAVLPEETQELVVKAANAVYNDYSPGNCEDWADILAAHLIQPEQPQPPQPTCGIPQPQPGDGEGENDGKGDPGQDEGTTSEKPSEKPGEQANKPGETEDGGDEEGEGEGTGPGDEEGPEEGEGEPGTPGEGKETKAGPGNQPWSTTPTLTPIDPNKPRQNPPTTLHADPLAGKSGAYPQEPWADLPELHDQARTRQELNQMLRELEAEAEANKRNASEASNQETVDVSTPYGLIDIHRHTLVNRSSARAANTRWSPTDQGGPLKYPHRLFDGVRVFARHAPGGSIICDGSGSMSYHDNHLRLAFRTLPRVWFGIYSSHTHRTGPVQPAARLCIYAADGRVAPYDTNHLHEPEHSGGNDPADLATLAYAVAHTPPPWVWVSDGLIMKTAPVDALMAKYDIVRVLTVQDAIRYLANQPVLCAYQAATPSVHLAQRNGSRPRPITGTLAEAAHPDNMRRLEAWMKKLGINS